MPVPPQRPAFLAQQPQAAPPAPAVPAQAPQMAPAAQMNPDDDPGAIVLRLLIECLTTHGEMSGKAMDAASEALKLTPEQLESAQTFARTHAKHLRKVPKMPLAGETATPPNKRS